MNERTLFFKFLPDKRLNKKGKFRKNGKQVNVRLRTAFFVNLDGQKKDQPVKV